jgi:hypothetical protein
VVRPWPGGENRRGGQASHHEVFEAMRPFLFPCAAIGVSQIAIGCLIGATPRGQPWTSAVTLPHGRNGLSARRMAVWWTFRELSRCRHVRRELMRNALLDLPPRIPATACHRRNYVGTYSKSTGKSEEPSVCVCSPASFPWTTLPTDETIARNHIYRLRRCDTLTVENAHDRPWHAS